VQCALAHEKVASRAVMHLDQRLPVPRNCDLSLFRHGNYLVYSYALIVTVAD